MKIFIAEGSDILRERLAAIVSEQPGFDVVGKTGDGAEAIRAVQEIKPDAVILNIRLADGSGLSVLEKIRNCDCHSLIVMLSLDPYPECKRRCLLAGADYFLDKAEDFEKIPELLCRLLRNGKNRNNESDTRTAPGRNKDGGRKKAKEPSKN